MSHLRIWKSNGVVYFAGQMPSENTIAVPLPEGTFRTVQAPEQMITLAEAMSWPLAPPLRNAKDQ